MAGQTNLLGLVKSLERPHKPHLQIDCVEGLIAVAQLSALELHRWNCAPNKPDAPGRLVSDLDRSPDVAFSAVVDSAREMRQRLTDLRLESFCKTTGGKGLLVVMPLIDSKTGTTD